MVFCSCGWRRVAKFDRHAGYGYYRCHRAAGSHPWFVKCQEPGIRQDRLDDATWQYVIAELSEPDRLVAEAERQLHEATEESRRRGRRIKSAEASLALIDGKLGQLLSQQLEGYPLEIIEGKRTCSWSTGPNPSER